MSSHYLMTTCDLPALQKLLGHATPVMTQRYAHLADDHIKDGIRALDFELRHNFGTIPAQLEQQDPEKDCRINTNAQPDNG